MNEKIGIQSFLDVLYGKFRFIESRLNTRNHIEKKSPHLLTKEMQVLSLHSDHGAILNTYRKDRRKDLGRANTSGLKEKWGDAPEQLITLFKNNVGQRTPNIKKADYQVLEQIMNSCLVNQIGEILSIYDDKDHLVASGFFLKHKDTVTLLVSSTDFKNRKNGANTFLINSAIYKYQKDFGVFNFGGSSMQSIAKYFLSFGAETLKYQQIKYHNLPYLVTLFKH